VFAGPGFELAKELSDVAHGGQVLMTHDAWMKLQPFSRAAEFPTIEQIGLCKLEKWPSQIWLYQVKQLVGRPLRRTFDSPRKASLIEPGWGLNIVAPPLGNRLCFVAVRTTFVHGRGMTAPPDVSQMLYELLASQAQQFSGYIFRAHRQMGRMLLAFQNTLDAVRFCQGTQILLLHTKWPEEVLDLSGPAVLSVTGRPMFQGPRVALAVHTSRSYKEIHLSGGLPDHPTWIDYEGGGERFVRHLCEVVNGGQTVLSDTAWAVVQEKIPSQCQVGKILNSTVGSNLCCHSLV